MLHVRGSAKDTCDTHTRTHGRAPPLPALSLRPMRAPRDEGGVSTLPTRAHPHRCNVPPHAVALCAMHCVPHRTLPCTMCCLSIGRHSAAAERCHELALRHHALWLAMSWLALLQAVP